MSSDTERRPIGLRTQPNRAADAIQSGGVRCTMTFLKLSNNNQWA